MNKDIATPDKPLSPLLRLNLDLPDGRHFEKLVHYPPGECRPLAVCVAHTTWADGNGNTAAGCMATLRARLW
jgi:hypothetical protein